MSFTAIAQTRIKRGPDAGLKRIVLEADGTDEMDETLSFSSYAQAGDTVLLEQVDFDYDGTPADEDFNATVQTSDAEDRAELINANLTDDGVTAVYEGEGRGLPCLYNDKLACALTNSNSGTWSLRAILKVERGNAI